MSADDDLIELPASLLLKVAAVLEARVMKGTYSRGAWRVVTADGHQIYSKQPYPGFTEEPLPPIDAPVCGDTKREAEEQLAALRASCAAVLERWCTA